MQIDKHKTKQQISLLKKVTLHSNNAEKRQMELKLYKLW